MDKSRKCQYVALSIAGIAALAFVLGIQYQRHFGTSTRKAEALLFRISRISAQGEINALQLLAHGNSSMASDELAGLLNLHVLALSSDFSMPPDSVDQRTCGLTYIHRYFTEHTVPMADDHSYRALRDKTIASLPLMPDRELRCDVTQQ